MKDMRQYLLGVVTQTLPGGSPAQHRIFNHGIEHTQELFEFSMYARYISHNDLALSYMGDALSLLHSLKELILLGWAGKKAKAKSNGLRTELVKKCRVDNHTNAGIWVLLKKRHGMIPWLDYISHYIDVAEELDGDFNLWTSSWWLSGSNRLVDMERCMSILPRDFKKHVKQTSRMVETPPITIPTTCHK